MPPKKRDRRRLGARPYRNYTEEMLALAIEMVQKKMSSYEAENVFGIPRRTIERKIKNLHMNKPGPPQKLSEVEQLNFVKVLIVASDFGAPLSLMDLRILVHEYLLKNNKTDLFNGNLPSEWWARNFIERHRDKLTVRAVQNIKKARAEKTVIELQNYFENLEELVKDVPPSNLINYDETNFSDDPGTVKCIFRRGIKYPERVMNSTKGCISVMFAASADGQVLPPFVVYKSESLFTQWVEGGPDDARYSRTKSGWFDSNTFFEWFISVVIPWARKLEGTKVMIGDNLSSHINLEVIELCEKYNIKFVLLPPNSTQLTQPLDVAFFGPLKKTWRKILTAYKIENPRQVALNKSHFPPLLKKVIDEVNMSKKENVVSGFKATSIYPFNPQKVLSKVPEYTSNEQEYLVDKVLLDYLKETRKPNEMKRARNKKINVEPGKSVTKSDLRSKINKKKENEKNLKITTKSMEDCIEQEISSIDQVYGTLSNNEDLVTKNKENKKKNEKHTTNKKLKNKMNQNSIIESLEDCVGQKSSIFVKICGTLSQDEDSCTKNKENIELALNHTKQNKKRKLNETKKHPKIKKGIRELESESTTSEDIELSVHSDSDLVDICSELTYTMDESLLQVDEDRGAKLTKKRNYTDDITQYVEEIHINLDKNRKLFTDRGQCDDYNLRTTNVLDETTGIMRTEVVTTASIEKPATRTLIENFKHIQKKSSTVDFEFSQRILKIPASSKGYDKENTQFASESLNIIDKSMVRSVPPKQSLKNTKKKRSKRRQSSSSTTTEEFVISVHSESDLDDINSDDLCKSFNVDDMESEVMQDTLIVTDEDVRVRQKVDEKETEIFKEIERLDKETSDIVSLNEDSKEHSIVVNTSKMEEKEDEDETNKTKTDNNMIDNLKIGDNVLVRYYLRKSWKYYVGVVREINEKCEKKFEVSYFKTIRKESDLKFIKPKRPDIDYISDVLIVKQINLMQIKEYPEEYVLYNDEDESYF